MGLIATMAALVLSLLIASGSSAYQAQENEVQSLAANVILLDRVLSFMARTPRNRVICCVKALPPFMIGYGRQTARRALILIRRRHGV